MSNVFASPHPLVAHKLSRMRNKDTEPKKFRELVREIAALLLVEHVGPRDVGGREVGVVLPVVRFVHARREWLEVARGDVPGVNATIADAAGIAHGTLPSAGATLATPVARNRFIARSLLLPPGRCEASARM